jgi:hypothetical protein
MPPLLAQLIEAAGGNVQPGAIDTAPIAALLEQGCDLDLDVLPAVRQLINDPQQPLKSWGVPWLAKEIIRRRDARMASDRITQAPAAARAAPARQPASAARSRTSVPANPPAPGLLGLDASELVAGYRAGTLEWNAARLGPPPGSPGERVRRGATQRPLTSINSTLQSRCRRPPCIGRGRQCPALARRHAAPWSRKMSATSSAGRDMAAGCYAAGWSFLLFLGFLRGSDNRSRGSRCRRSCRRSCRWRRGCSGRRSGGDGAALGVGMIDA